MARQKVEVGKLYKLKNDAYVNYGYQKGDVVKVQVYTHGANCNIQDKDCLKQVIGIPISCLAPYEETKQEIETKISELKDEIKKYQDKLTWMKTAKVDVYDEDEFKVWQTLELLGKKNLTQIEKAKHIATLIKNQ